MDRRKSGMLWSGVSIFLGVLCMLYGAAVLAYAGFSVKFHFIWFIIGVFFILLPSVLHKVQTGVIVLPNWLKIGGGILVVIGVVSFLTIETILVAYACQTPKSNANRMIVLGCQVRGEKISRALRFRLDTAYDYLAEHKEVTVIVSGGKGPGEDISEAEAMERYLVERGIEKERIIQENQSTNTVENIKYSKAILDDGQPIIVVSNGFHMFRAVYICKKQGFQQVEGLAGSSDPGMIPTYYLREYFAVVKDFVMGNM